MAIKSYGMFTDVGNRRVGAIVTRALAKRWTWAETYQAMQALAKSNQDLFGEVFDTDVPSIAVWDHVGFFPANYLHKKKIRQKIPQNLWKICGIFFPTNYLHTNLFSSFPRSLFSSFF
jgi:hypothetical protein